MIEFHAGSGPDSQSVGIALEEMFLDYRVMPGRAPVPVTVVGNARLPGASNILMALARKTSRFLPGAEDATPWLGKTPPGLDELEARLATHAFILGPYSIVDMATYPRIVADKAALVHPNIARWVERMRLRPEVERGMVAVAG
jgi:hypothetical protein